MDDLDEDDEDEDMVQSQLGVLNPEDVQVQREKSKATFDRLIEKFKGNLSALRVRNKFELEKQYRNFTDAYKEVERQVNEIITNPENQVIRAQFPYNPTKISEYGLDFLSFVDPHYVADIKKNYEWYL